MKLNITFTTDTSKFEEKELLNIVNDFQWANDFEDFDELSEVPEELILKAVEDTIYNSLLNYYDVDDFKCNEEN